jgi:hypothetical protein
MNWTLLFLELPMCFLAENSWRVYDEREVYGCPIRIAHFYHLKIGAFYQFTLQTACYEGAVEIRRQLFETIGMPRESDLGFPKRTDLQRFRWPSASQEFPKVPEVTETHQQEISRICRLMNLDPDEEKLIDEYIILHLLSPVREESIYLERIIVHTSAERRGTLLKAFNRVNRVIDPIFMGELE